MNDPTEEEKDRIRDAAHAAIERCHSKRQLPEDGDAIDAYFMSPWSKDDFRSLTEEELENMRRRFKPDDLPWLDKTRKQP